MESQHLKQQEAQGFYRKMGYTWSMDQNDFILIAKAKDEIIGVIRISEENGFLILSGMFLNDAQKRQISSEKLLRELEAYLQCEKSFCIPNSYLKNYYKLLGFESLELKDTPSYLRKELVLRIRLGKFSKHKNYRIIMRKHKSGSGKLTLLDSTS